MSYADANMPLTTGSARALLPALFAGKGYHKRAEIIDTLTEHHNKNGGKPTPEQTRVSVVKKALNELAAAGLAEKHPHSTGYWRIRAEAPKGAKNKKGAKGKKGSKIKKGTENV